MVPRRWDALSRPFLVEPMANYAATNGCKTAAVINQNGDDYSTGLANYFKDAFAKMDGCSVVYEGTYNTNETDFNAILAKAKEANPDVIFVPSSITTAGLLIKQARDMALKTANTGYVLETGRITLAGTGRELLANESVKAAYPTLSSRTHV